MTPLTPLEKLEWALMTVRDQLTFNLPPEQAIIARERRVRGVLADVVKTLKKQDHLSPKELGELVYLVSEKTAASDFEYQDQDRQDFLNGLEKKLSKLAQGEEG